MKDIYLVIGGSGFVGRHIVQQLLERGDNVSVFDIVQRYHDTPFYPGDISEKDQVAAALRKSGTTCIIHTASPIAVHGNAAIFWKVNVNGTEAVVAAAVECGVKKLVYTSSAGVVFNGGDIVNVDERLPPPEQSLDAYNESKAKAEKLVLEANGKGGLLTVALRPAGIFGPGDRQAMVGLYKVYEEGKTHFQIGDNDNLFDWTCVENVAYAHLLAADKLNTPPPAPPVDVEKYVAEFDYPELTEQEDAIVSSPLRNVDVTTGRYRIPTSDARPLGPFVQLPKNGEQIQAAFDSGSAETPLPINRARFDPLSDHALSREKLNHPEVSPLQVAGQVFFITNGEPIYFWDLPRTVWRHLDEHFPEQAKARQRSIFKLSKSIGLLAATGAEWYGWLVGKEPAFTRYKVTYSCVNRWHNIEKARRVLGYEPKVSLQDGIKNMVDHWWADHKASGKAQ